VSAALSHSNGWGRCSLSRGPGADQSGHPSPGTAGDSPPPPGSSRWHTAPSPPGPASTDRQTACTDHDCHGTAGSVGADRRMSVRLLPPSGLDAATGPRLSVWSFPADSTPPRVRVVAPPLSDRQERRQNARQSAGRLPGVTNRPPRPRGTQTQTTARRQGALGAWSGQDFTPSPSGHDGRAAQHHAWSHTAGHARDATETAGRGLHAPPSCR
jgi:hypothetical protein